VGGALLQVHRVDNCFQIWGGDDSILWLSLAQQKPAFGYIHRRGQLIPVNEVADEKEYSERRPRQSYTGFRAYKKISSLQKKLAPRPL
jgi:hypothetical protein